MLPGVYIRKQMVMYLFFQVHFLANHIRYILSWGMSYYHVYAISIEYIGSKINTKQNK